MYCEKRNKIKQNVMDTRLHVENRRKLSCFKLKRMQNRSSLIYRIIDNLLSLCYRASNWVCTQKNDCECEGMCSGKSETRSVNQELNH